ncbi:MAG: TIGR01777 family oxidoreductase [Chthoniobacteraceae bacterium]
MNIGITGATGLIGKRLVDRALQRGHEVIAFSRSPERQIPGCEMRPFSVDAVPDVSGCDAFVHLAGESVVGLWTPEKKRRIVHSRVEGTRRVAEAILGSAHPPEVLVSASAVGFYADSGDSEITEAAPPGRGFLADTVQAWEEEAAKAAGRTRVVLLRTGIVLAREGGALGTMLPIFKAGLGGTIGTGVQWMPWIHLEDVSGLILFAVENLDLRGPMNATGPWPVRNADFTQAVASAVNRPAFFRVPAAALRLLGEFSHELLDSKRVLPAAATEHGYPFRFPELAPALKDLLG